MKKLMLALAALAAVAVFAAEGWRADTQILNSTGGVSIASCRVGDIARVDYSLDKTATLELVRAVGSTVLSTTTITNAAGAGTVANLGWIGGNDYFRLHGATNAAARIYVITK